MVLPRMKLAVLGMLIVTGCGGGVPGVDPKPADGGTTSTETEAEKKAKETEAANAASVTLSGTLALSGVALTGTWLAPTLDSIEMFCVTFEETPRAAKSDFDATGKFSLTIPKNVNFGCFVNDKVTHKTLASVVVEAAAGGLGSGGQSALAISGSLDLGNLTIGADGTIKIPQAKLDSVKAVATAGIVADDLNSATYVMTCQASGNDQNDAQCKQDIADGNKESTVFLRILKGTAADGHAVLGLGVWQDEATFTACGGFDMTADEVAKIKSKDGIDLTQVSAGVFTIGANCSLKDKVREANQDNIAGYFALSELVPNGAGFSFRAESHEGGGGGDQNQEQGSNVPGTPTGTDVGTGTGTNGPTDPNAPTGPSGPSGPSGPGPGGDNCQVQHTTGIEFTGTNAVMFGAFSNSDVAGGGCNSPTSEISSFSVKFTKK